MPLHYFLNPVVLGIAVLHWSLSRCHSTALPEWGLVLMTALMVLGLAIKFRVVPKGLQQTVYRLHTHPVTFFVLIAVLILSHSIVD